MKPASIVSSSLTKPLSINEAIMFSPNPSNSASSSAPTTNSDSGSSGSRLGSGRNTPNGLITLAEGNAFGDTCSMLNFGMTNASSFIPINGTSGSGANSHSTTGANTPTSFMQADVVATSKGDKLTGREKGAFVYGVDEHLALLSFIQLVPSSFNASESSPEWKEVHKKMVEVYEAMNVQPRQSSTLHSHFVELYSALKLGI
jgi:hypothetical protein